MTFPVSPNAPQFVINGATYAIDGFNWSTPFSTAYYVGVFIKTPDGTWNAPLVPGNGVVVQYLNENETIADMQSKGGRVKYLQWLLAKFNDVLLKLFGNTITPIVGEPKTEQEARDIISAWVLTLKVTGNNPPVVS